MLCGLEEAIVCCLIKFDCPRRHVHQCHSVKKWTGIRYYVCTVIQEMVSLLGVGQLYFTCRDAGIKAVSGSSTI